MLMILFNEGREMGLEIERVYYLIKKRDGGYCLGLTVASRRVNSLSGWEDQLFPSNSPQLQ